MTNDKTRAADAPSLWDRVLNLAGQIESHARGLSHDIQVARASKRRDLTPDEQRDLEAAAATLEAASATLDDVHVDVPELTDEERDRVLAELQALFKDVPRDVSLVDELIAERREEARREAEE